MIAFKIILKLTGLTILFWCVIMFTSYLVGIPEYWMDFFNGFVTCYIWFKTKLSEELWNE